MAFYWGKYGKMIKITCHVIYIYHFLGIKCGDQGIAMNNVTLGCVRKWEIPPTVLPVK
jgi:hypothetical protein